MRDRNPSTFVEVLTKLGRGPSIGALVDYFTAVRSMALGGQTAARLRSWAGDGSGRQQSSRVRRLATAVGADWWDWRWHLRSRVHVRHNSPATAHWIARDLVNAAWGDPGHGTLWERVPVAGGDRQFDFSVLPLNLVGDRETLRYFTPPPEYSVTTEYLHRDPYGLVGSPTRSTAVPGAPSQVVCPDSGVWLGSQKFPHTLLMNVGFTCPIGCVGCYKTAFGTREYSLYGGYQAFGFSPPTYARAIQQAARVVRWLNEDPRGAAVYDLIVSGGEPLLLSDETLVGMLDHFRSARSLHVLRFCTGTLFLGLPMRWSDTLVRALVSFSQETGIRVTVQAHLATECQIGPEAISAATKLRKAGITVYTQVPIKEGVNFFSDDLVRSVEVLASLCRRQVEVGVEPYMFIVDMQPTTGAYYTPIERLLFVWGQLVESHDHPGLERPRTLSILSKQGNIILSGPCLFAMGKDVNRAAGTVTYRIPRVGVGPHGQPGLSEWFTYAESLSTYNSDPTSLRRLRTAWESRPESGTARIAPEVP